MAMVRRRRPGPRHLFIRYNAKIADITHADTALHTLTLANGAGTGAIAGETRKIIAVLTVWPRIAGTGAVYLYPNEGASRIYEANNVAGPFCVIADNSQQLQYALSVANDDYDLYCMGYVVET